MNIKLNSTVNIDLSKLIESRLLIQANSGGGKSYTIRRIIEQSFGKVQIIVLDPEGEFTNLRERYDFVYIGKDGDSPAQPRSAAMLARKLLELKASAIIDLYELPPQERKKFVRLFCEAMVNAPKELWHDTLIIIDEAHVFAPEKGESEAMGAVIDIATRGRKRGFCVVLATQRISKLNKDAAAECNNKLIGRSSLDIDRKRAAEELGFSTKEQIVSLRNLEPGSFYVFGPAISREVSLQRIGDVKVKPAERGVVRSVPPPPTEKVKKILAKLADLPQEAEKELRTVAELRQRVSELERDLKKQPVTISVDSSFDWKRLVKQWSVYAGSLLSNIEKAQQNLNDLMVPPPEVPPFLTYKKEDTRPQDKSVFSFQGKAKDFDVAIGQLNKGEREILTAIAQYDGATTEHVAILTGYKATSRREYLRKLMAAGYVHKEGETYFATDAGFKTLGDDFMPLPTGSALREHLLDTLPEGERKLFYAIITAYPDSVTRDFLQEATGYKTTSVREYVRKLAARKIIEINGNEIKVSNKLYE